MLAPPQQWEEESIGSIDSSSQAPPETKRYEQVLDNLGFKESEEKPFWAQFLKSDYQKEQPKSLLADVMDVLGGKKTVADLHHDRKEGTPFKQMSVQDDDSSLQGTP